MAELLPTMVFYLFAAVTVFSAAMVISSKNPVHSVFFLILAFFNSAGLFILIGAEYIAMTLVIVYVGAVAVLFLFVVMMLDINFAELRQGFQKYLPMGALVALIVFAQLVFVYAVSLKSTAGKAPALQHPISPEVTNTEAIGQLLYTWYLYPFQLAGLILLVAMIGAIVLTLRTREGVRRQNVGRQMARKREDSVAIVKVKPGQGA
jgi:NADH-quinone oxidoreductase subunit J